MKWRKLKKAALVVACVVPGASLLAGDELANLKYHKPKKGR
jgi:hypothetical protein